MAERSPPGARPPRFTGYPNPRAVPIIDTYIASITGVLDGFSPAAAGYVRFQVPIDPSTLPANPDLALQPTASVQLIDIDSSLPEHGKRKLISVELHTDAGVYYQPNTLAFLPTIGFPLRTHTHYALVVTDAVRGAAGETIAPSPDLRAVLGLAATDARTAPAQAALAPALAEIASAGIAKEHIVTGRVHDRRIRRVSSSPSATTCGRTSRRRPSMRRSGR